MDKDLEDIIKRIENNANKIEGNLERIQKNSYALEILGDYKTESARLFEINKRLFFIIILLLVIIIALGVILAVRF